MSTVVLLRSSSPSARAGEDLGPAPLYPHELAALRSRPGVGPLTVSTTIEVLKTLHTPESGGTSTVQDSPVPTTCIPFESNSSIPPSEDHDQNSAASTTTTSILSRYQPHGDIANKIEPFPQTSVATDTIDATTTRDNIPRLSANWEELTPEEKAQCQGPQCPSSRLGKTAWFVVGPLRDSYTSGLGRLIKKLVNANHRRIFQQSKSSLNFSPVLLSASKDVTEAEPVVLILTGDPKLGRRAQNIITRSSQYSKHNLGFKIEVDVNTVFHPSDGGVSYTSVPQPSVHTDRQSLCSKLAFVKQLSSNEPIWTRTTIGGVVKVRHRYYALIVAHCLLANSDTQFETFDNDDGMSDDSAFVDVSSLDEDFEDQPHFNTFGFGPANGHFAVYLDGTDDESSRLDNFTRTSTSIRPIRPILLSHIFAVNAIGTTLVSFDNDCALVPLTNHDFQQPNWFSVPGQGPVLVNRIGKNDQILPTTVYVGTGTSGPRRANVVENKSHYAFHWTRKIHEVFTIDVAIEPGDSGAWIFDCSGCLYGVAVATAPYLSLTYAIYVEDLFAHIASLSNGEIDMDQLLPQAPDSDIKRVPKAISFASRDISSTLRDISCTSHNTLYASQGVSTVSGDVSCISKDVFSTSNDQILLDQEKMLITREKWRSPVAEQIRHRPARPELSSRQLFVAGMTLMLITFAHSFDAFVLYNTLPSITDYFNTVIDIGWYVSAYWICVSVLQFPFKRISEDFGGMPMCLVSVIVFEVGCLVSGFAQISFGLVAGRTLAGIGSCGMMASVLQIVRQQTVTGHRDTLMTLVGSAFFVGQITGLLIGGAISQYGVWQWCFWVNPPLGVLGIFGLLLLRKLNVPGMQFNKPYKCFSWFGIIGFVFFTSLCISFLLWLLSARIDPSWHASKTVGLIVGSAVAAACALVWSFYWYRRNPSFFAGNKWAILFCCNRLMIALESGSTLITVCYLSIWFQAVKRFPAFNSAASTLPIVGTAVVVRALVNLLRPRLLRFASKWLVGSALVGVILQLAGTILVRTLNQTADAGQFIGYQFLIGIGSGLRHDWFFAGGILSVVEAASMLIGVRMIMIHAFGAAIFLAIAHTIFIGSLETIVLESAPGLNGTAIVSHGATDFLQLAGNNTSVRQALLSKYNNAISDVFFLAIGCSAAECLVAFIVCFVVLNV